MKAWPWQAYFCSIWSVCSVIPALSAAAQLEYSEFCKYLLVKWYLWLHPCTLWVWASWGMEELAKNIWWHSQLTWELIADNYLILNMQ